MNNKELNQLIEELEFTFNEKEAYFGIFRFGNEPDENCIKANKEGLQLFSLQLLRAAQQSDEIVKDTEKNIIPLNPHQDYIDPDSDYHIHYIEPNFHKPQCSGNEISNDNWKDSALKIGFLTFFVIIIGLTIIGGWTIFKWLI